MAGGSGEVLYKAYYPAMAASKPAAYPGNAAKSRAHTSNLRLAHGSASATQCKGNIPCQRRTAASGTTPTPAPPATMRITPSNPSARKRSPPLAQGLLFKVQR